MATSEEVSLCLNIAFPNALSQFISGAWIALCHLTANDLQASGERRPSLALDGVEMIVGLELGGHHRVVTCFLVLEVQGRVPVIGHVGFDPVGVAGRLLGRSEVKGRAESVGTEDVVDMVAGILARRDDGIETFADEGRPVVQDEVATVQVVRRAQARVAHEGQKAENRLRLACCFHVCRKVRSQMERR